MTLTVTELKAYSKNKELMDYLGLDENSSYDEIYRGVVALAQEAVDRAFAEFDEVSPQIA